MKGGCTVTAFQREAVETSWGKLLAHKSIGEFENLKANDNTKIRAYILVRKEFDLIQSRGYFVQLVFITPISGLSLYLAGRSISQHLFEFVVY